MSFVNEDIPEEDNQRIDFSKFKHPRSSTRGVQPGRWSIDRERDVFLIWIVDGGEDEQDAKYFLFGFSGTIFHICLERKYDHQLQRSIWHLQQFYPPESIRLQRDDMLLALKEALTEYGSRHRRNPAEPNAHQFQF